MAKIRLQDFQNKEEFKGCGVYAIYNPTTNQIYVGSSIHIGTRLSHHLTRIRDKNHSSNLYKAIRKTGTDKWYVTVLQKCEPDERAEIENMAMATCEEQGYELLNEKTAYLIPDFTDEAIQKMKDHHINPQEGRK